MARPSQLGVVPMKNRNLAAERQDGPRRISRYAQRKLRLVFARLPLDARQTYLTSNICLKGASHYAIR